MVVLQIFTSNRSHSKYFSNAQLTSFKFWECLNYPENTNWANLSGCIVYHTTRIDSATILMIELEIFSDYYTHLIVLFFKYLLTHHTNNQAEICDKIPDLNDHHHFQCLQKRQVVAIQKRLLKISLLMVLLTLDCKMCTTNCFDFIGWLALLLIVALWIVKMMTIMIQIFLNRLHHHCKLEWMASNENDDNVLSRILLQFPSPSLLSKLTINVQAKNENVTRGVR